MRLLILTCFLFFSQPTFSQDFNIGLSPGYTFIAASERTDMYDTGAMTLAGLAEYQPKHAIFSINSEIRFLLTNEIILNFPLYVKFNIGNKLKFCPSIGGFLSSNGNYGGQAGLNIEYPLAHKLKVFCRYEYFKEVYTETIPSQMGSDYEQQEVRNGNWVGAGIKFNLL